MMKIRRKDKRVPFKDVPCGKAFMTENDVYMKCYEDDTKNGEIEFFGVTIESGRMVLFSENREVVMLDMEVTEL